VPTGVYPGKQSGLIVDYANVFTFWRKRWRYMARRGGETPVRDKKSWQIQLWKAVRDATESARVEG